jgi:hypothetical protein
MGRLYTASFENVTVSAIQDLFEINAASGKSVIIHGCVIGQTSDVGDAAEEILRLRFIEGYTTSGSGGSTPTGVPLDKGDSAFGGTVEANNTTVANTGTAAIKHIDSWNVRTTWLYLPPPEMRIRLAGGLRLVLHMPAAPADALSVNGSITFEEIG